MTDIVERLRAHADQAHESGSLGWRDSMNEAADEITRLRAALRDARAETLEEAARECDRLGGLEQADYGLSRGAQNYYRARNAIRALKDKT